MVRTETGLGRAIGMAQATRKGEQRNEVGRWRRTGVEEATEEESGGERGSSAEPEAKMVRIQGSEQAGAGRGQGTQGGAGQRAGTDRQEGKEGEENKEQRTPRKRRTRKKDKKEEQKSRESAVPVGGGKGEWVGSEWV